MTCLKLTDKQEAVMGQTVVIHQFRLVHISCKLVYTIQIVTESFTVRKCVVLASRRHVEWEVISLLRVVQDLFAILSSL